jgi:hypothetical protein
MADKKMFVIPIYLIDTDVEDEKERLGLNEDEPAELKQTAVHTIYVSSYWIDVDKNRHTGTKDIVFYIDGVPFRTPYTKQILHEVIWPAMQWRAADDNEVEETKLISPN